ncbi:MAG: hypothetical protein WBA83_16320 [Burkholderiaceae bacterium]
MLQDLDSLAARIGQMVQFTRQLQSERSALLARLKTLEQERDALRDQVQRREADYSSAAEKAAEHEAQIQSYQAEAQAAQATLQVDVARYRTESESFKQRLAASQADTLHLRQVADQAREQIDSILMRLPGAPRE